MDKSVREKYTAVIGLEVHVQLTTHSKIFSSDATQFGAPANTQISEISLAYPGTLPKLNKEVVASAVKMGFACQSEIAPYQIFDRKNYFYPDLPKGYQITQSRTPVCRGGMVVIRLKDGNEMKVALHHIHLEEDAGKSIHQEGETDSQVDFNRAGVPLIEIVTEPVMHSSEEAGAFLAEIRRMVRYLGIGDANMEEGSLRCDANVSVKLIGADKLGSKVEIKNMNSIRNVQRAIDYEIHRQVEEVERGHPILSETRMFDADNGRTFAMRTKEELNDYRYFPDPDLSPVMLTQEWLNGIKSSMPLLPQQLFEKLKSEYQLPSYDAQVLTDMKETAIYFLEVCRYTKNYKAASNWIMGPIKALLNDQAANLQRITIPPKALAELIRMIDEGKISHTAATHSIFSQMQQNPEKSVMEIAVGLNLVLESGSEVLLPLITEVIREFPLKVEEYKNGKKGIISMFMGEVMKRSRGKADPRVANELLLKKLDEA